MSSRADALNWYFFVPTEEEWDAGLRYLRCDVAGLVPPDGEFTYAGTLEGARAAPTLPPELGDCLVRDGTHVPCSAPHVGEMKFVEYVPDLELPEDPAAAAEIVNITTRQWCGGLLAARGWPSENLFAFEIERRRRSCGVAFADPVTGSTPLE